MSRRLLALVVAAALLGVAACDGERALGPRADAAPASAWVRAADSPLSPRYDALTAWVGDELLVVGGRDARCGRTRPYCRVQRPARRDGAAYDPETDTWRVIPPAPDPVGDGVVVGDLLVVTGDSGLHAYDADVDRWLTIKEVFSNFDSRLRWLIRSDGRHLLAAAGDGGSFGLTENVQSCAVLTHRCHVVPRDRTMYAATLLATDQGPGWVGSTSHSYFFNGPNRVDIFRDGHWHRTTVPGSTKRRPIRPTVLDGDRLVALDGDFDAPIGSLDVATGDWRRLRAPGHSGDLPTLRAVGDGWLAAGGWLLSSDNQWTRLGHPPGAEARSFATGTIAGGHLYLFGGSDFSHGVKGRPTDELWIRTLPGS